MRLPGIWLFGALTLITLAFAGFFYEQKLVVIFSIMAMGFAYATEFLAQEFVWGRHWYGLITKLHLFCLAGAVSSAALAFYKLVA